MSTTQMPQIVATPSANISKPSVLTNILRHTAKAFIVASLLYATVHLTYITVNNSFSSQKATLAQNTNNDSAFDLTQEDLNFDTSTLVYIDVTPPIDYKALAVSDDGNFISLLVVNDFDISHNISFPPKAPQLNTPLLIAAREERKAKEAKRTEIIGEIEAAKAAKRLTIIQPFGGITWDDDLLRILSKVQEQESLEHIKLSLHKYSGGGDKTSINISTDANDSPKLQEIVRKAVANKSLLRYSITGIDKEVLLSKATITASPIIISNGIFELKITFLSNSGYAFEYPDKALAQAKQVLGNSFDLYYPLQLESVSLTLQNDGTITSSAPSQAEKNIIARDILALLKKKYRPSLLYKSTPTAIGWRDNKKHELALWNRPAYSYGYSEYSHLLRLHYSSDDIHHEDKLAVHQRKLAAHQRKLEEKAYLAKHTNKPSSEKSL